MGKKLTGLNPLAYIGVEPESPADLVDFRHNPDTNDTSFNIGTMWINTTTDIIFILTSLANGVATWTQINGVSPSPSNFPWNNVTGTSASMAVGNGYVANNAGIVTLTLPVTAVFGSVIKVCGNGAGGWKIAQNAGQLIKFETSTTTTGVTGYLASTVETDCIDLICTVANTTFVVKASVGNITVS